MLEDTDGGQLEDIDVIPNEEMLLVHEKAKSKASCIYWSFLK